MSNIPFDRSFASHPKSKYWSELNKELPINIYKSTRNKFIFNCNICNHIFDTSLYNVSCGNNWCPYCSNNILCNDINCKECYFKSFASSNRAKQFSSKNGVNPRSLFKSSNKLYIFICDTCDHEFEARLNNISKNKWCPFCAKPCKKLCDNEECIQCFNNSFYSNYNSLFWSNKNEVHPRNIIKSSKNKFWFDCHECNHSFEASLDNIINNKWCPYCAHFKLCEVLDCIYCFNNSFSSIDNSKYLIDKSINTRQIFKYSNIKYDFNCNSCLNDFNASIHHISEGSWCPLCKYKTEKKLHKWLIQNFNSVKQQVKYQWCVNRSTNKHLIFDFEIENKIIIELDGAQHFRQISNWLAPDIQKERDKFKINCCLENSRHIIHILQEDVLNNTGNWEKQLKENINTLLLINEPRLVIIGIGRDHFS